jgi:hypothetical protein
VTVAPGASGRAALPMDAAALRVFNTGSGALRHAGAGARQENKLRELHAVDKGAVMSRRRLFSAAAVSWLATLTAGCASFPTQEFNRGASQGLHTIAVAPVGLPDEPSVVILNAVGNSFGLVGAIVEASRASNASKEAVTELSAGGFDYRTYLPGQIDAAVKAAGFEVTVLPGTRSGGEAAKFLTTLPAAPGADAVLDVYVSYLGYAAAGAKSPYRPAVHLEARLVDPKTQKVLFADQIYYNNFTPAAAKRAITIEPDPKGVFPDRAAMRAAPAEVTQYLRAAVDAATAELGKQLK